MIARLRQLLRAADGPHTRDLRLRPGALGHLPERLAPDGTATLVCGFCSTGCGLDVHLRGGRAVNLAPSSRYPVNGGNACPKGWEALAPLAAPDRAVTPLLGGPGRRPRPIGWAEAMEVFTARMRELLERHGPESVAFLSTGQLPTEELAFLGALTRIGMGIADGDSNTRQCMATSAAAYKEAFGFDAPPYTYADFEASDVVVLVGANPCIAHPILWERLLRNPHRPRIVVVDPRRTETAQAASLHLPILPKSDLTLFYGAARALVARGRVDRAFVEAHTSGFEVFAKHVEAFTLARVLAETGLDQAAFDAFVDAIAGGERVSFWWTMGVNQSHQGVKTAQAIIDLALMTGNIGRPGTGANSITGQCNAMGSRLFANTTNLLGGHDFADPAHRAKVAAVLGVDEARIPDRACRPYDQIIEGILSRRVRGLWIIGTNPAHSWINQNDLHDALSRLDFLVVQDMYTSTETARLAHLLLPAAGWGEKDGTFINSERRLGVVARVAQPPGEALADFHIFQLVAEAWGLSEMFARFRDPESTFAVLKELSRGQPCDFTGIEGYRALDQAGGIQWPCPAGAPPPEAERRLFADGRFYTPDGRARFCFTEPRALPEPAGGDYPLTLLTGRGSASQWHTLTRSGKSPVLRRTSPSEPYVEVNPADAARLGLRPSEDVTVRSRRGAARARVMVTPTVQPGQVFMPMHFPEVNRLTFAAFDPQSRQPAYKACAVRIDRTI